MSAGGVVVAAGGATAATVGTYALFAEMSGSASGDVRELAYIQPIPVTESVGTWETPKGTEITLPSGATYEHEQLDRERSHGWEQIKRLPGVEQPSDIGQIIEENERQRGFGGYDIIVGDNPNAPGKTRLWLLDEFVLFAEEIVENPRGVDREFLIPPNKEHAENRDQEHFTSNEDIRRVVENANEVYTNGHGLYVWILYEGGSAMIVHGYDHSLLGETKYERIVWSTSYIVSDEIEEFIEYFVNSNLLDQMYPAEDK